MSALGGLRPVEEIVIVDDGSTDQTLKVARSMADEHSCVTVSTQPEPGGAAVARLRGARLARNEWIALLDSDDYLSPDAVSDAYDAAISHAAEVSVWAVYRESCGIIRPFLLTKDFQRPMTGREATRLTLGDWKLPAVGVMRRDLFVDASERVNVDSFNEDELVSRELLFAASRVAAGPGTYFYVDNVDSTTQSQSTDRSGLAASHRWLLEFSAGNSFFKDEPQLAAVLVRHGIKVARTFFDASDPKRDVLRQPAEVRKLVAALQAHAPPAWRCGFREIYRGLRGRSVRHEVRSLALGVNESMSDPADESHP